MQWRIYLCPIIGTGLVHPTHQDHDPFRPKIYDMISVDNGEGLNGFLFDFKQLWLGVCWAETATHTTIAADTGTVVLSPLKDTLRDLLDWMDTPVSNLSANAQTKLEALNIDTGWITAQNTVLDVLKMLRRLSIIENKALKATGEDFEAADFLLKATLATNGISAALRTKLQNWGTKFGVSGTITAATTVRAIIRNFVNNANLPPARLLDRILS